MGVPPCTPSPSVETALGILWDEFPILEVGGDWSIAGTSLP